MKKRVFQAIMIFILATISLATGIVIIPEVTNIGKTILHILIGVVLLIYCYGYLVRKVVAKAKGTILVLSLLELVVLTLIAITAIIDTWVNIAILTEGCLIIGIAFWIRGVIESFRSHFNKASNYPLYKAFLNIILITVGTWFYVSPIISNFQLLYVFAGLFICSSIALIILGIIKLKK